METRRLCPNVYVLWTEKNYISHENDKFLFEWGLRGFGSLCNTTDSKRELIGTYDILRAASSAREEPVSPGKFY